MEISTVEISPAYGKTISVNVVLIDMYVVVNPTNRHNQHGYTLLADNYTAR